MITHVIFKEILKNIRDLKLPLLLTIMPIAIITLMGLAMDNIFSGENLTMDDLQISYFIEEQTDFSDNLLLMLSETLSDDSKLIKIDQLEVGRKLVENDDTVAFMHITKNEINYYVNASLGEQGEIVQGILKGYIERLNVYELTGPIQLEETSNIVVLNNGSTSSAMDYYGLAMTFLFIFYTIPMPFSSIIKEQKDATLDRMLMTPIGARQIIIGKVIGNFIVITIQITIVFLFTWLILKVNWGQPLIAWLLLVSFVGVSVSIGSLLGLIFRSENIGMVVIHIGIAVMAFFSGNYMPLTGLGFLGKVGKYFSPMWWNMNGILDLAYNNSTEHFNKAIIVNIIFIIIVIALSSIIINRKEQWSIE